MLAEGGVQFNKPISFTPQRNQVWTGESLPAIIHSSKQALEALRPYLQGTTLIISIAVVIAYIVGWLALTWVGCRGQFIFIDNIVRNRAAITGPWVRYAREGNVWFLFLLGLSIVTFILIILTVGLFLLLGWAWISQERNPQGGEVAAIVVFLLASAAFWCVAGAIFFIIRSFAIPLMFRQTSGLGGALGTVFNLIIGRPLSMLVYVLVSFVLAIAGSALSLVGVCLVCCCIFWIGLIPIIGSLLMTAILAQLLLPLLVFYRCFQIECLSQFGPAYDIWRVDVPPAPSA
jgi:hypothetical protein